MHIRIVGPGDEQRRRLEKLTREVAAELHLKAQFEVAEVADLPPGAAAAAPALLVDGMLKVSGRVPSRNEIGSWLQPRWS